MELNMQKEFVINNRTISQDQLFNSDSIQWSQYSKKGCIKTTRFKKLSYRKTRLRRTENTPSLESSHEQLYHAVKTMVPVSESNSNNVYHCNGKYSDRKSNPMTQTLQLTRTSEMMKDSICSEENKSNVSSNSSSTTEVYDMNGSWESLMDCNNMSRKIDRDELRTKWTLESMNEVNDSKDETMNCLINIRESVFNSFANWNDVMTSKLKAVYENLQNDLAEVADEEQVKETKEESIDILQVRRTLIRVADLTDPIIVLLKEAKRVCKWENPAVTFIVFTMYMYSVYKGWLLTIVMLFLTVILIYFYYWTRYQAKTESSNSVQQGTSLNLKGQVAFTVFILRKYQVTGRGVLEILEKVKNLFLWRQPEVTQIVFSTVVLFTLCCFAFSATEIINFIAYYLGVHAFMISNLFLRYPRLARKYDVANILWNRMLTDNQYEEWKKGEANTKQFKMQDIRTKESLPSKRYFQFPEPTNTKLQNMSSMLNVPLPEPPLAEWRGGRRCTLVTKSTSSTTNKTSSQGLLYLTERYLCFEGTQHDKSNASFIPLDIVKKVEKVNIYTSFVGGEKGISVSITSSKAELFSTILNRDEAYESLIAIGKRNQYKWSHK